MESTEVFADVNPADFTSIKREDDLAHLDPARYRLTPGSIEHGEPLEKLVERLKGLTREQDPSRNQDNSKVGFVYVLFNPRFPDLVKIGQTNSSSSERANFANTTSPTLPARSTSKSSKKPLPD